MAELVPIIDSPLRGMLRPECDPRAIREAFLSDLPSSSSYRPFLGSRRDPASKEEVEMRTLSRAATDLPAQYGVVRNVVEEVESRLGKGWVVKGVVEISGALGPGLW